MKKLFFSLITILSIVIIIFLFRIVFFSTYEGRRCYLSKEICVNSVLYNNNYYYNFSLEKNRFDAVKDLVDFGFLIDFKEFPGVLYVISQELKDKSIDIKKQCSSFKKPFGFNEEEYQMRIYKISKVGDRFEVEDITDKKIPNNVDKWFEEHYVNQNLEFIC